jgi:anthranilate 1,2-dioxygenase small subunit
MSMTTMELDQDVTLAEARALLCDYAAVLDDGALADWPKLFTDDGIYRIATRENERRGMPLPIMLCDSRAMLYDRVEACEKANIFEPHWYRHILSDSRPLAKADGTLTLQTSFICIRTMQMGEMSLFVSGVYVDQVVRDSGKCCFRSKTVVLDQSQIDTLIAIPL